MKILYITPYNPIDRSCGGDVRSGALLKALRKCGEVRTVLVPGRVRKVFGTEGAFGIHMMDSSLLYEGRLPWSLFVLLSCLARRPIWGFPSRDEMLRKMGVDGFDCDVVVVRYLWCAARLGVWRLGKSVYVDVDDSPDATSMQIAMGFPRLVRPLIRWMYSTWQGLVARRATGLWVSNADDVGIYNAHIRLLPNMPQLMGAEPCEEDPPFLFFVGSFRHLPNLNGVDLFLKDVWCAFRMRFPQVRLKIAGMALPDAHRARWSQMEGVELLGYVDDLADLYSKCIAVIVPQIGGSGTSVKLVEAVSNGCKVFANEAGARGFSSACLSELQVSVIHAKEDFLKAFGEWMLLSRAERRKDRLDIRRLAQKVVGEGRFDLIVETMIVG